MAEIALDYTPRSAFLPFHTRDKRWATLVVHRRGGKTVCCVWELVTRALYSTKENARYAYVAPFYRQAKDVAWEYLKQFTADIASDTRESELRIKLPNKAWITLYGADNPDALRGLYLDGVVLDEYGDCRPSLWGKVVRPTLSDRKGWAVFIGTPKGRNHFYDVYRSAQESDRWFCMRLKASDSGILDHEELREMRADMTEEEWNQEMECDFDAALVGTYYTDQLNRMEAEGRFTDRPLYDPREPVNVAADLGFTDSTAFWFWQDSPSGPRIVDYEEDQGRTLAYYFNMLSQKPYAYGSVWLPHDSRASTLQTGVSTIEQVHQWFGKYDADAEVKVVPKFKVQHGIDAVRSLLPTCTFYRPACEEGIQALRAYRRRYDEVLKAFSNKPLHDWASDGADGFRYLATVCSRVPAQEAPLAAREPLIKTPEYKLANLFEERENKESRRYQKLRIG